MKALITGGCGQVGSHVAEMLLARGDTRARHRQFRDWSSRAPNTARASQVGRRVDRRISRWSIDLVGDFKPDVVIHTAASYKDPDDWHSDAMTNVVGGANLIRAAKDNKVSRFIYFQTALCYGLKPLHQPIRLDHPMQPANSSYAISKTAAEDYLEISGLDYVTFRLANVIGPRNVSGPLPIFYQRLSEGKQCFVTAARRDFVFVKDLARTVLRAVDGTGRGAYHFSSGTDIAIKELYDAVVTAMKLNDYPEPEIRSLGPDEAPTILLDPSRTVADFGAVEFTPLKQTVAAAIDYFRTFGTKGGYTHLKVVQS